MSVAILLLAACGGQVELEWQQQGENLLNAAVRTGQQVMRGLQVADFHRQMAQAHEALGETEAAHRHWVIYFERWPMGMSGPDFQRLIRDPAFQEAISDQTMSD